MERRKYTLFWLNGKSEIIEGLNFTFALRNAGYGNGSLAALDFYGENDIRDQYEWDEKKHTWRSVDFFKKHNIN